MLVLNLLAFKNKKIHTAYDRFHGDSPYVEIPTNQNCSDLSCHIIKMNTPREVARTLSAFVEHGS